MQVSRVSQFAGILLLALGALAGCAPPGADIGTPPPAESARLEATVYLSARGPDQPDARFDMPWRDARETVVTLVSTAPRAMAAALSCDGPARLRLDGPLDQGLFMRAGAERRFTLPARHEADMPAIVLPPETRSCELTWGEGNRLALLRENIGDPEVAALDARTRSCDLGAPRGDALAAAFFANRGLAQTCARSTGSYKLYADEVDALQVRLERLTGAPVSRAAIEAADPDMPLDFSRAPRFDQIVVSYLQVRADISGYLTARALAVHAARGTKVRVAVSGTLALDKDRRLLEALAAQYPNVQLQYFRHSPKGFAPLANLAGMISKSHHIKLFAGLSSEPGHSFALVGGRNLHDGFFYPDIDYVETRPELHNYGDFTLNPLDYVDRYEDFEIGLFSRTAVEDVLAQFGRFWNRDAIGSEMSNGDNAAAAPSSARRDGLVRHYISLPWQHGLAQEDLFVDMIDAARREVTFMSPFVYPTPAIDAALLRAVERGVRVRLVVRLKTAEPAALVVNSLNSHYLERRRDDFEVYVYDPHPRTVHTKLFTFDDRVAIVTSTNLNQRSFHGDSENGFVFLDSGVARKLREQIEIAMRQAEPATLQPLFLMLGEAAHAIPGLIKQF